jgi:uncharacterized protein
MMKKTARHNSDPARLESWQRYTPRLCDTCHATCCSLAAEVTLSDLIRLGFVDPFMADEPPNTLARTLLRQRHIEHYHHRSGRYTLARNANGDCALLDPLSRRCRHYANRPDTCRNHPQIGPRPGYCPWQQRRLPAS